mgnify:FL=1
MVDLNGTLVLQILNFIVLVLILAKYAYKPLLETMEERKRRIENDLVNAEQARAEATSMKAEYTAQLQEARKEAQAIIETAKQQAEAESQAQIKELRAQLVKEKELARQEIEREREKAMQQIRAEVVNLSVEVAAKLIGKEFSSTDNVALVEDTIAKLDSTTIRS